MFNTKVEVDRHVENCLKNTNSESERNIRYLPFAKLYFKVGDYEQARRYVTIYLNVKPESAEAQQLLGRILEKLGKLDAALEAYRTSLDLDPKQNKLVLKVCELLASDNVNFDQSGARYFCEKAQSIDPNNPSIYSLKEKLILSEGKDPNEVTKLLLREVEDRPCDVCLRVRLLRHFLQNNQIKDAYDHVRNIEQKHHTILAKSLSWHETVAEVLIKCQHDTLKKNLNWEFWMLLVSVLDRLVDLSLDERSISVKTNSEYISNVFNFDQSLKIASESVQDCSDRNLVQEFLRHYRGQLCLHFVTLVYKQAKKELMKYKEATEIALPLLFAAYNSTPPDLQSLWITQASESTKELVKRWNREAAYRCSQVGHMLLSLAKDRKGAVIERANQSSSGLWREKLLKRIFITRDLQSKFKGSYFMTNNEFVTLTIRLPDGNDLIKYDDVAQFAYPDSLHHYIWIGLNRTLPGFKCTVFDGLPYSNKNLSNCSAESLNVLDVQAFLYCAILCAQQQIEHQKYNIYHAADKPNVLPAAVTGQLGTQHQSKWFLSAYKMLTNDYTCDFSEVRMTLIRGIETIRCVGNHGLDVKILVTLAKIFTERSKTLDKPNEVDLNDARAELYWKTALPLLEKLKNNQTLSYPPNRLFECKSKEMSPAEIQAYIDDGRLFSAVRSMKKKDYERALAMFDGLKDPYASYYQAQIYKMKAEEQTSRNKESVTSEMRSQNIILLSRARDCLYLTFDRLRDPSVDRRHPLNSQLGTEIDKIERLLSRIEPDTSLNRNECDGMSDENMSSLGSMGDHFNYTYGGNSSFLNGNGNTTPKNDNLNLNSTPLRLDVTRREARPSPERLDAQLRQLLASKDTAVTQILEQNKFMMESHRALLDEIRGFKNAVNHLTSTVDEMKGFRHTIDEIRELQRSVNDLKNSVDDLKNVTDDVLKMKKEIAELKKDTMKIRSNQISDEDLYGLDEEYGNEYAAAAVNQNMSGMTPNLYPALGRLPQPNPLQYGPALYHNMYPMLHYPGLGLPHAGPLPYGPTENQLADFRSLSALPQGLGPSSAPYLQPGLSQGFTPGALQHALSHGPLPQTVLPPQVPLPQTTLGQSPHSLPMVPPIISTTTTPAFSAIGNTTIPNQSVFVSSALGHPSFLGGLGSGVLPMSTASSFNTPSSRAPPVNVVITSSDPLPPTKSTPQPILSVTIPPQHLKGNQPKNQPHNYQIQMPIVSTITTPSVIKQPPLAISTQNLLSNVPPPVYSSIDMQQTKTVSFIMDKSLNQNSLGNISNGKIDLNKSNTSSGSIEEHDPCPDFKPIIPLPDEVPVNTGEENETVLFEERAKLFRYTNKEWRERGVGVLKLLKDTSTGKVRLLMRRDQVHKICANHFLTEDMVLTPMPNNDKAYMWAANDFADQEIVLEKLCVRFKTAEIAQKFHDSFERAKRDLPKTGDKSKEAEPPAPKVDAVPVTLMGGFVFTSTPTFKPKPVVVDYEVVPKEVVKTSPFASFSFSKSSTTVPSTVAFSPVVTVQSNLNLSEVSEGEIEEYEPAVDFKPIVPLPELVEVKTGEENAEVLFAQKAKLLRYDQTTKEWKERGVGLMKILKYSDNTVRLIMRREQVHKVCCNHQLLKSMSFISMPTCGKALTWYAQDFSEGILSPEMLAAKFKTEESAKQFLNIATSIQANLDPNNYYLVTPQEKKKDGKASGETKKGDKKSKADPEVTSPSTNKQSGWGDKYKPKLGTWECKNCYIVNDAKTSNCIACDSVKKESSNATQFSFGVKNQSPGGQTFSFVTKTDTQDDKKPIKETVPITPSTGAAGWGNQFKPPADSWECSACFLRNTKDRLHCASCENPKDDTVPKKEPVSKGINLDTPGFSFNFGIPNTAAQTTTTTIPATSSFSFGATPISKSPAITFSFGSTLPDNKQFNFSIKPEKTADSVALTTTPSSAANEDKEKFVFGSPQKHTFDFTPRSPRRHSGGHGEEESESSYVEEEEDNIYFKPVIPLPEKVDVKTGEELEEVLYCHRAKLFRFTDGEWKERGIGDIKVLRKPDTGKLRVVMRREQVLKICLNHTLTKEVVYTAKDDKTWLFSAADFSEGEIQHKQFCIRFKNGEVAKEFKKSIDRALDATVTDTKTQPDDDSDVEIIFETQVTPEEEAEAKRLGLPPKFMSYRQLEDCCCSECKKDDVLLKEILSPVKSSTNEKTLNTPSSSLFGTPKSFATPTADKTQSTLSFTSFTNTPPSSGAKEETVKDLLIKPSLFGSISATQLGGGNKLFSPTFSSPALVSAATNQQQPSFGKPDEKTTNANGAANNFTFTLSKSTDSFQVPNAFGGKTTASTTASPFFSSSTNLFSSPLNTSNTSSIFTPSDTKSDSIFGGNFSAGNLFNTKPAPVFSTATTTPSVTPPTMFGTPVIGGGNNLGSGDSVKPQSDEKFPSNNSTTADITTANNKFNMFTSPPVFGSALFGNVQNAQDGNKSFGATPIFGNSQAKSVFGNSAATLTFGSNTQAPAVGPLDCTVNSNKEEKSIDQYLKCDPALNFANLAKESTNTTPAIKTVEESETTPFAFLGAGAPVFGGKKPESTKDKSKNTSKSEENTEGNTSVDEEYDPHYEPIVPLPEAIAVVTGEEDETDLFNERAKLFRYDVALKEWKERGIGQLKILYHPANHTYRLLLRREQVHKVVLNQLVTPDLYLQPMSTSEKAWCWGGYNYSEDDHCLEKLAARFKTVELSKKFYDTIQNAIEEIKNYNSMQTMIPSIVENYAWGNAGGDEDRDTGEEEEDDLEYYDDDDDERTMFKERCTLSERDALSGEWKPVGSGNIIIYFDNDIYGARISVNNEHNVLSNTLIGINTEMNLHDHSCTWRAVEWENNVYDWRDLRATFETEEAAERFHITYQEAVTYAEQSEIFDAIPTFLEPE